MSMTIYILLHTAVMLRTPVKMNVNTLLSVSTHPQGGFSQIRLFHASGMVLPTQIESKQSLNVVSILSRPCELLDQLLRPTARILVPGVAIFPRKIRKRIRDIRIYARTLPDHHINQGVWSRGMILASHRVQHVCEWSWVQFPLPPFLVVQGWMIWFFW
jgi:hypothetical protein